MISRNEIKFVRQLEQKKYRTREGLFVAEGPKVVGDLMDNGFIPRQIFATGCSFGDSSVNRLVSEDELRKMSFLQHPQQVLALFEIPQETTHSSSLDPELYLALDGIQNPGNMGTIIRVAHWFGISRIFCSADTVDAWSPKVVQATMGSIASVKVVYTDLVELLSQTSLPVYGTLLDGSNIYAEELSPQGIIVMGNEGNGISDAVRCLVTKKLLIPAFHRGPDSLNVAIATAITCSEFRRRMAPAQ
ncbi:MAG: RNA methyltransferase [Prevotella sp.]|nr:RNA methyltransferase [Prevotella sp.]